ncbi:MAG: MFS transporter [SAR202 cluster bacterium]|nr:MFS transporter [SAR202 cluster bacterium]
MSRPILFMGLADFLVRSAYQMGKTPLLPIFAASLGASDSFIGLIISVSTLTGMIFKPVIGFLSDIWGRRSWLLVGTAFFTFMPFVYTFVDSTQTLFTVRLVHGFATAVYGPVSLAYVAERAHDNKGELLGWFGIAKTSGYVIGPLSAGLLLMYLDPEEVFTLIGILSSAAFIPVLLLAENKPSAQNPRVLSLPRKFLSAIRFGAGSSVVWISGALEGWVYMAVYAVKAFLPIYGLAEGFNVFQVGIFFAVQELVHIVINPLGGRLGDKFGYLLTVVAGMVVIAGAIFYIPSAKQLVALLTTASVIGVAQALIFPSTLAMISIRFTGQGIATGMAISGSLKNAGKIAGPIIAGLLITMFDYDVTLRGMGLLLASSALVLVIALRQRYDPARNRM